ncbi:hypothetical protein [Pseudomonas putida]|uniref:DUF3077 domain-containing protein n=1 Tax=Pseudomonas putida TaxID=303 RepID=A0A2C5W6P8_PSEPU|nr:hypothetical protein [Pseudomonas putida]PHH41935.1 hypothetical protein CRX57_17670 [Pseudomonas putida]
MSTCKKALEIREAFEEAGNALSLFIDLCTSDIQLTQRSILALSAYGRTCMNTFEDAERWLRSQDEPRANFLPEQTKAGK